MSTSRSFKVEDFVRKDDLIEVEIHEIPESDLAIPITISTRSFYNFLLVNDLLNWEMNMSDYRGEHVQASGQMSYQEYWQMDHASITKDLYDYIISNPIIYRGNVHTDSVQSIMDAFETRRLQRIVNPEY